VVKVHTGHGVITLPGSADSWEAADNAVFVADSIADVQIVNNEIPWRISYQ
jgi:osmotically-inducible protein OsmY